MAGPQGRGLLGSEQALPRLDRMGLIGVSQLEVLVVLVPELGSRWGWGTKCAPERMEPPAPPG